MAFVVRGSPHRKGRDEEDDKKHHSAAMLTDLLVPRNVAGARRKMLVQAFACVVAVIGVIWFVSGSRSGATSATIQSSPGTATVADTAAVATGDRELQQQQQQRLDAAAVSEQSAVTNLQGSSSGGSEQGVNFLESGGGAAGATEQRERQQQQQQQEEQRERQPLLDDPAAAVAASETAAVSAEAAAAASEAASGHEVSVSDATAASDALRHRTSNGEVETERPAESAAEEERREGGGEGARHGEEDGEGEEKDAGSGMEGERETGGHSQAEEGKEGVVKPRDKDGGDEGHERGSDNEPGGAEGGGGGEEEEGEAKREESENGTSEQREANLDVEGGHRTEGKSSSGEKESAPEEVTDGAVDADPREEGLPTVEGTTNREAEEGQREEAGEKDGKPSTAREEEEDGEADTDAGGKQEEVSKEAKEVAATAEAVAAQAHEKSAPDYEACHGKLVYIYSLPGRYNKALVGQCQHMLPWYDMCPHFLNHGLGKPILGTNLFRPRGRWFETHTYALEVVFHYRLLRSYPCVTDDPEKADLFYIPFYASLDVMRWQHREGATREAHDELSHSLIRWLKRQPWLERKGGRDHAIVLGKVTWDFRREQNSNWGNNFLLQTAMKLVTKLVLEANPWDPTDVAVPHLTPFHPRYEKDYATWQHAALRHKREALVSYAPLAAASPKAREALTKLCKEQPNSCRFMDCAADDICSRPAALLGLYMTSAFCLLPPGHDAARRAAFDALLVGCIPVFFDDFVASQYKWFLPRDNRTYSLTFPLAQVLNGSVNVIQQLRTYRKKTIRYMRQTIVERVMPGIVYSHPRMQPMTEHKDAFDIAMTNLLQRVKDATLRMPTSSSRGQGDDDRR